MMQTIISENFVQWIILRHTSGIAAPGSADILFMRGLETGESPLAGSIRNIRVLNQAITENTTINLSLHLNFLHTLINKAVREIHLSAARHMGMLEKGFRLPEAVQAAQAVQAVQAAPSAGEAAHPSGKLGPRPFAAVYPTAHRRETSPLAPSQRADSPASTKNSAPLVSPSAPPPVAAPALVSHPPPVPTSAPAPVPVPTVVSPSAPAGIPLKERKSKASVTPLPQPPSSGEVRRETDGKPYKTTETTRFFSESQGLLPAHLWESIPQWHRGLWALAQTGTAAYRGPNPADGSADNPAFIYPADRGYARILRERAALGPTTSKTGINHPISPLGTIPPLGETPAANTVPTINAERMPMPAPRIPSLQPAERRAAPDGKTHTPQALRERTDFTRNGWPENSARAASDSGYPSGGPDAVGVSADARPRIPAGTDEKGLITPARIDFPNRSASNTFPAVQQGQAVPETEKALGPEMIYQQAGQPAPSEPEPFRKALPDSTARRERYTPAGDTKQALTDTAIPRNTHRKDILLPPAKLTLPGMAAPAIPKRADADTIEFSRASTAAAEPESSRTATPAARTESPRTAANALRTEFSRAASSAAKAESPQRSATAVRLDFPQAAATAVREGLPQAAMTAANADFPRTAAVAAREKFPRTAVTAPKLNFPQASATSAKGKFPQRADAAEAGPPQVPQAAGMVFPQRDAMPVTVGITAAAGMDAGIRGTSAVHSVPGAAIVYRREAEIGQPQPPSKAVAEDIEFIKKTVTLPAVSTQTKKVNTAVNLPKTQPGPAQSGDFLRDAEVNAIADKVYSTLERRLRSERMRKGML